jgi:hypothetical protein
VAKLGIHGLARQKVLDGGDGGSSCGNDNRSGAVDPRTIPSADICVVTGKAKTNDESKPVKIKNLNDLYSHSWQVAQWIR